MILALFCIAIVLFWILPTAIASLGEALFAVIQFVFVCACVLAIIALLSMS
jgi:hypothetical protein